MGEARPICKTDSVQLTEADDDGTTYYRFR